MKMVGKQDKNDHLQDSINYISTTYFKFIHLVEWYSSQIEKS